MAGTAYHNRRWLCLLLSKPAKDWHCFAASENCAQVSGRDSGLPAHRPGAAWRLDEWCRRSRPKAANQSSCGIFTSHQ